VTYGNWYPEKTSRLGQNLRRNLCDAKKLVLAPVLVLRDGSLLQLFIRLYEQVFGSSCMAAKLIVVISLCFVDPLPGAETMDCCAARRLPCRSPMFTTGVCAKIAPLQPRTRPRAVPISMSFLKTMMTSPLSR
jgi:hypothetical protein